MAEGSRGADDGSRGVGADAPTPSDEEPREGASEAEAGAAAVTEEEASLDEVPGEDPLAAPEGHRSGFVAIVGRPNAGKSALLNRILDTKIAAVSPVPQTTRHRILGVLTRPDFQAVFVDTPGIHKPLHEMNRRMLKAAWEALEGVELILLLVDASKRMGGGDRFVLERLAEVDTTRFLVPNKIDLIKKSRLLPMIEEYREAGDFAEFLPISAETGDGVDLLVAEIREYLPEGPRYYPGDQLTDVPLSFRIAEIVREHVFRQTRQEVPHSAAVTLDSMDERDDGLVTLHVSILVEKENQKGIVIGKQGRRLKKIGTAARKELEGLLGTQVHLDLWVKAAPKWREDMGLLDKLLDPYSY